MGSTWYPRDIHSLSTACKAVPVLALGSIFWLKNVGRLILSGGDGVHPEKVGLFVGKGEIKRRRKCSSMTLIIRLDHLNGKFALFPSASGTSTNILGEAGPISAKAKGQGSGAVSILHAGKPN